MRKLGQPFPVCPPSPFISLIDRLFALLAKAATGFFEPSLVIHRKIMGTTFKYDFETEGFTGKVEFPTGLFINGEWRAGSDKTTIEYVLDYLLRGTIALLIFSIINPSKHVTPESL